MRCREVRAPIVLMSAVMQDLEDKVTKPLFREGGRKIRCLKKRRTILVSDEIKSKQETEKPPGYKQVERQTKYLGPGWEWVESSIWTENMLKALGNGVKGGKWFSLIDKVYSKKTLALHGKK